MADNGQGRSRAAHRQGADQPSLSPSMKQEELQAYISKNGTFAVQCPSCFTSSTYRVADLPGDLPNPFGYDCTCGRVWSVRLIGFRHGQRKRVQLAASLVRTTGSRGVPIMATVQDLSVSGMRLVTDEKLSNLAKDEVLKISCILNNPHRNKLNLTAKVRRIMPAGAQLAIAVEFLPLSTEQLDILDAYLAG